MTHEESGISTTEIAPTWRNDRGSVSQTETVLSPFRDDTKVAVPHGELAGYPPRDGDWLTLQKYSVARSRQFEHETDSQVRHKERDGCGSMKEAAHGWSGFTDIVGKDTTAREEPHIAATQVTTEDRREYAK